MIKNQKFTGFCSSLALMLCLNVNAQINVSGSVIDMDSIPVPFAHVLLLSANDSSLVKGAITDDFGKYSFVDIYSGTYLLSTSVVGFSPYFSANFSINKTDPEIIGSTIQIKEDAQMLEGVTVAARQNLYERKVDRTVVNVKNSVTATGGTALEVLEKSPGIVVNRQNGSISMNGKSGVTIMINGKMSRLPLDAVVQMLEGMSSSNIEKVELITTPPAKFDAEGNAGIINFITIDSPDLGTNFNLGGTLGYNGSEIWGVNGGINHKKRKIGAFLNYSIRGDAAKPEWRNESSIQQQDFIQTIKSINNRDALAVVQNLRAGLSYDISEKTSFNVLITGYQREWNTKDEIITQNIVSVDTTLSTIGLVDENDKLNSYATTLGLSHNFSDSAKINVEFDYLYYDKNQPSSYDNTFTTNNSTTSTSENILVERKIPINFEVFKVDYSTLIKPNISLDLGVKGSLSNFTNTVTVLRSAEDLREIDESFSGVAELDEQIGAVYTSIEWKPNTKWNIQGGIRYEYTDTFLSSTNGDMGVDREFGNLFPSLFMSHVLSEDSKITFAFSRRISRPSFNDLAPSVFFINPTTILTGNLNLRPSLSKGLDFGYEYKKLWLSIKYNYTKNEIVPFQPEIDLPTETLIFRSQNLKNNSTLGLHMSMSFKIVQGWDFQNTASINFDRIESQHLANNVRYRKTYLAYNGVSSILLPKDFILEFSGNFRTSSLLGVSTLQSFGRFDIGIKKELKNGNGTITLVGNDLFGTTPRRRVNDIPEENINTFLFYDFRLRSILLKYSLSLGNSKIKTLKIKSGAEEEKKRVE